MCSDKSGENAYQAQTGCAQCQTVGSEGTRATREDREGREGRKETEAAVANSFYSKWNLSDSLMHN